METLLNLRAEAVALILRVAICGFLFIIGWCSNGIYYASERSEENRVAVEQAAKVEKDASKAAAAITDKGNAVVRSIEENLVVKERRNEELYLANARLTDTLLGLRDAGTTDTVRPYQLSFTPPTSCPAPKPAPSCESAKRIAAAAPERAKRADSASQYSEACYQYLDALKQYRQELVEYDKKYGGG